MTAPVERAPIDIDPETLVIHKKTFPRPSLAAVDFTSEGVDWQAHMELSSDSTVPISVLITDGNKWYVVLYATRLFRQLNEAIVEELEGSRARA